MLFYTYKRKKYMQKNTLIIINLTKYYYIKNSQILMIYK